MSEMVPPEDLQLVDAGVDHGSIADELDTFIFYRDDSTDYCSRGDKFIRDQLYDQLNEYSDVVQGLKEIVALQCGESDSYPDDVSDGAFSGGVTGFAVLDAIAHKRGVDRSLYRKFWLEMEHIRNGDACIDFLENIDMKDFTVFTEYYALSDKLAREVSKGDEAYDAFIGIFMFTMITGKQAQAKAIISNAGMQSQATINQMDLDIELAKLLGGTPE